MASLDDLVKASRSKRVQVADLPDAPKLQPTIRSGGQYTVAVQQAGRNKLMDLADALSKVNPILQQYGAIQKAEREYQREQGELFAMESPEKAMATLEAQRDKTKQELRKLREQGVIDERSDREFVLQEMIQPMLMDMTERGNVAGALRKIQQLKDWKINEKGAKFITSTMQDSLNALERTIVSQGAYWQQQAVTTYNSVLEEATGPFTAEFLQRLNEGKPITENYFKDWSGRAREELSAKGVKPNNVEEYITKQREEANKTYNRQRPDTVVTDSVILGSIRGNLNLGIDQKSQIDVARDNGELSLSDYKSLLQANADETDFEANVMRRQSVRDYSDIIENRFSDKAIKDGIPIPMVDNATNIVKDITGIIKKQIPGNTLITLKATASQIFRDEMRKERDQLVLQGMGQLSRPELDRQLDERVPEVYNNISPQIEEMVKTRLRTAQFNLGSYFDKDVLDGFDRRDATSVTALNKVLHRIGFEEDDYQGKADFLNSYRANHID
jgi:hypothetical protein